jgi:hypothetical protein
LNPRTWVPEASTLSTRPPKPLFLEYTYLYALLFFLLFIIIKNVKNNKGTDKGNKGNEREPGHYRHHREEETTIMWPRENEARGQNTKLIMEWILRERRKRGRPRENVDGRSTSSHDNEKFRTRSIEK